MLSFSHHFSESSEDDSGLIKSALETIKAEMDEDRIGYYRLPKNSASFIDDVDSIDTSSFEQVVVVGIGGSSLGIKAIDSILRPVTQDAKEIIFFENSDPLTISENLSKITKEKACFFIISKSGSTIETTSIFKTIIQACELDLDSADSKRVFAITDAASSLSDFAKHHALKEFNIPANVGGRFSVLSAVGIVPLYIAGYDVRSILEGAQNFLESFFEGKEDHLLEKAAFYYKHAKQQSINVVFSYADRLENFTKWYVQLWGESLGKIDNKGKNVGLTPIGLIGSVDQHSFLQLIIEGPKDKTVTFINIEDFQKQLEIPNISLYGIEKTDFINTKSFNTLINAQCEATMSSVIESGVNADTISLDCISAENMGTMIIYYELLTSLVGAMLHVNTYNQPGVELGKQILYKNLGN